MTSPTTSKSFVDGSTRRAPTCASTSCGSAGRSSRPRPRARPLGRPGAGQEGERRARAAAADLDLYESLAQQLEDAETLAELAREEDDDSQEAEIETMIGAVARRLDELELRSLFTGEHDEADAICAMSSGEGGADAQDWAEMLCACTCAGPSAAASTSRTRLVAGIRGRHPLGEFIIRGRYAYGWLKAERGVHRLVRISPFDGRASGRPRFAALTVCRCSRGRGRHRDRRRGPRASHVPLVGRRRPARQHDVVGGAPHPPADRHRRRRARTSAASTRTRTGRWRC